MNTSSRQQVVSLDPMRRVERIHFVGVGGAGMGGIAEVLQHLKYKVSGSDIAENAMVNRLRGLGVEVYIGHQAANVQDKDVVVVSSAIKPDNPEVVAANEQRIPIIPRAEMLAELMRFRNGIAVAGTHGKTTTTSLIATLLSAGDLDPTYVIGGLLNSAGTNARLGSGKYLVAEADESDASFLHLQPVFAVVTNIDADHLETYGGDFEKLKKTFIEFLHHIPFYGAAVLCVDDEEVRALVDAVNKPVITYGTQKGADVRATRIQQQGSQTRFTVQFSDGSPTTRFTLNLPGKHNVLNATAAIAIAHELGVTPDVMSAALEKFEGIGRRFHIIGERNIQGRKITFVDDYGHHPREVEATLEAVRAGWKNRLVVIFQPHRYTRTRDLFEDFVRVLSQADVLVLMDVYPAGEAPIAQADGRALARAIRNRGEVEPVFVEDEDELMQVLPGLLQDGDICLTSGAGDIGRIAGRLPDQLSAVKE